MVVARDKHDLKQGRSSYDVRRNAEQIDHRRDHEPATDTHDGAQEAYHHADGEWRYSADVQLRSMEAHLQRQLVHPEMLARTLDGRALP